MNVLSLTDGISAAHVALIRAGFNIDNYFSSEIDPFCIQIINNNFPNTIHLGDIRNINIHDLPHIDIIIGGTPCQGFSLAGKRLNWSDPRSTIFNCYADLLSKIPHDYFIFENVPMHITIRNDISRVFGKIHPESVLQRDLFSTGKLNPIVINSCLVSGQNRLRLYWTNIQNVEKPKDKHIFLEDILESGEGFTCRNNLIFNRRYKSTCIDSNYFKGIDNHGQRTFVVGSAKKDGKHFTNRVFNSRFKSPTLLSSTGGNNEVKIQIDDLYWRILTPIECERLQTLPDNYTEGISKSQRYKTIGNSFTVDVIAHILSYININKEVQNV